jgi:hypothetical protein
VAGIKLGKQNDKETKNCTFVLSRQNFIGKQITFVYNSHMFLLLYQNHRQGQKRLISGILIHSTCVLCLFTICAVVMPGFKPLWKRIQSGRMERIAMVCRILESNIAGLK